MIDPAKSGNPLDVALNHDFTLRFSSIGEITIERGGVSQTIPDANLRTHGWNALAGCARLIELKHRGEFK